jgi:hypothetical protein
VATLDAQCLVGEPALVYPSVHLGVAKT